VPKDSDIKNTPESKCIFILNEKNIESGCMYFVEEKKII
jgi:hypothetical protein